MKSGVALARELLQTEFLASLLLPYSATIYDDHILLSTPGQPSCRLEAKVTLLAKRNGEGVRRRGESAIPE